MVGGPNRPLQSASLRKPTKFGESEVVHRDAGLAGQAGTCRRRSAHSTGCEKLSSTGDHATQPRGEPAGRDFVGQMKTATLRWAYHVVLQRHNGHSGLYRSRRIRFRRIRGSSQRRGVCVAVHLRTRPRWSVFPPSATAWDNIDADLPAVTQVLGSGPYAGAGP
jgi:hypothetical protein